jgi:hypothetical protein
MFPSVTRRRSRLHRWQKFVPRLQPRGLDYRTWAELSLLGQIDVLHTQNFEIQVS